MYATDDVLCPVKSLKLFLEHINTHAASPFIHLEEDPEKSSYWYDIKPVGKTRFSNFMPDTYIEMLVLMSVILLTVCVPQL